MDIILNFIQNAGHIILYYLFPFIVVLGIMIFFHELGHFLVAKYFGVKVLKFALGFGPKIVWKEVGETEYSIRYIPLGGFVKMLGEDEGDEENQDLAPEDAERAFNNKPALQRIAIVAAGPFSNLLLAFFLYWALFFFAGIYIRSAEIGEVKADSPASRAGLLKGDIIKTIQGKTIEDWFEIKEIIFDKAGVPIEVAVQRGDEIVTITVIPEEDKQEVFKQEVKIAILGILASDKDTKKEFGLWGAMEEAANETWKWVGRICKFVVKLITGAYSIKMVGGPITILDMTGQVAQIGLPSLISFMAMISINLAILNLFPIPVLDGGLIIFLFVEMLIGRPISSKKRELVQKIGLSLLIALMIIVIYNDILRVLP